VIIVIIAAILVWVGAGITVLCTAVAAGQSTRKGNAAQAEPVQIPELMFVIGEHGILRCVHKAPRKRGRFSFIILFKHKLAAT
jgi:hypothetical protein